MSFIKPRSTETIRDRLLTAAEMAILDKGFAATSIKALIAGVGITKCGFFYHFKDKSAVIEAILKCHLGAEEAWLDGLSPAPPSRARTRWSRSWPFCGCCAHRWRHCRTCILAV